MQIAEKVRKFAKLSAYRMAKILGKKSVNSYLSMERSLKISIADLLALERIYIEHGGNAADFRKLMERCK